MSSVQVSFRADLEAAFLAHARWCSPQEACGVLAIDAGGAIRFFYPITNRDEAPDSFTLDQAEFLHAANHAESMGWEVGGIMHSHPAGGAIPSATDVREAPAATWLHVVVADAEIGYFRIQGGTVRRVDASGVTEPNA